MQRNKRTTGAFALYEVLLGLSIFVIGVLVLGRSVQNCLNASIVSAEDDRIRQILANRMAEIQASPGFPDERKETTLKTGYGEVKLIQSSEPANLKDDKGLEMGGINRITLQVQWNRGRVVQLRKIEFYVNRGG